MKSTAQYPCTKLRKILDDRRIPVSQFVDAAGWGKSMNQSTGWRRVNGRFKMTAEDLMTVKKTLAKMTSEEFSDEQLVGFVRGRSRSKDAKQDPPRTKNGATA